MNELIKVGKRRTVLISISVLLVSMHSIYLYHAVRPEIEINKLVQQVVRFGLTFGLLYAIYIGKNWAKVISIILFSIALLGVIITIATIEGAFVNKIPMLVMITVYTLAIYHFGFSKSFKAFFEFQKTKKK